MIEYFAEFYKSIICLPKIHQIQLWQIEEEIFNLLLYILSMSKKRLTFQSYNRNLFYSEERRSYFYEISCTLYGIIFIKIDNVSVTFSYTRFKRTYGDRNVWTHEFIYISKRMRFSYMLLCIHNIYIYSCVKIFLLLCVSQRRIVSPSVTRLTPM